MITKSHRFIDRVFRLLERVEYRRVETVEDKQAIYRMRHEGYTRAGTLQPHPTGMLTDADDETNNVWLIGLYIDGELASSVRLHVAANADTRLPAVIAWDDIVTPRLKAGKTLIDFSRFVSARRFSREYPELPYITLRPGFAAGAFFGADYFTAGCRDDHQAFYMRMFGSAQWALPRPYPKFAYPIAFLYWDYPEQQAAVVERYPFFGTTATERFDLFRQSSNPQLQPPVYPKAERAVERYPSLTDA